MAGGSLSLTVSASCEGGGMEMTIGNEGHKQPGVSSDSLYDSTIRMVVMPQSTSLLALVGVVGFALISLLLGVLP